jgi:hypothetical protein
MQSLPKVVYNKGAAKVAIHEAIHPFHCSICSFSSVCQGYLVKHSRTNTRSNFKCSVMKILLILWHFSITIVSTEELKHSGAENAENARLSILRL